MPDGGLSGWRIARIFGITVRIHATWLLIFFLLAYSLAENLLPQSSMVGGGPWWRGAASYDRIVAYQRQPGERLSFQEAAGDLGITVWPTWQYWLLGIIGSIGLFVCVLAHEIAHSLVARGAGIPVEGITLFLFGGVSQLKEDAATPGDEFRIAAVGPLMSLALGVACGALYYGFGGALPPQARAILYYFTFINLALVVFNLLPGFPLDGGRLLRAVLWRRYGDVGRATAVASWWGKAIGTGFVVLGLVEFWWEFTVAHVLSLGPLWLVVIGLFLRHAARASYQQLAVRGAFEGLTAREALQPGVVTVPPDLMLDRVVDEYFYKYKFRSFPVLEEGRLVGVISLKDVQ
ncbi:MAG: CBS domain-containing protein, partial [Planctomycetes bacterium]|nr:CBS domain-containing protein [Planctomycetota bacterium]